MFKRNIVVIVFLMIFLFTASVNCFAAFEDLLGSRVSATLEEDADFEVGPEIDSFYLDNVTGGIEICEGNTDKVTVNVTKSITARSQSEVDFISYNMNIDADIESDSIRISLVTKTGEDFWDWLFKSYPGSSVSASFVINVPKNIQSYSTKVITGYTLLQDLDGAVASTITTGGFTAKNVKFLRNSSINVLTGNVVIEERMGSPEELNIETMTGDIELNVNRDDLVKSVYAQIVDGNIEGLDSIVIRPAFITALTENDNDGANVTLKVLTGDVTVSGLPLKPVVENPDNELPSIPEFEIPKVEVPVFDIPKFEIPEIEIPVVNIPDYVIPEVEVPVFEMPTFEMPIIEIPVFQPCGMVRP